MVTTSIATIPTIMTERKRLIKKLDKLWASIITNRAGNQCEKCGRSGRMNAHHIEGRRKMGTRWNLSNGLCLCITCHTFGQVSAHSTSYSGQKEFHKWLLNYKGQSFLDELEWKSQSGKWSIGELAILYNELLTISKDEA